MSKKYRQFSTVIDEITPKLTDPYIDRAELITVLNGCRAGLDVIPSKKCNDGARIFDDLVRMYRKTPPGRQYNEKRKRLP